MKPGWKTTEFWTAATLQILSVLGVIGILGDTDRTLLADASTKAIAGMAAFLANAWVVVRYIQSRTTLKAQAGQELSPPSSNGVPLPSILALFAVLALTGVSAAQGRPRVGEEVRDGLGNLVYRSSGCGCEQCGPGCTCGCQGDAHVRYRSREEQRAFLIWIWNRRNPEKQQQPTDPAILQALAELRASNQRLADLVAQMQRGPAAAPQIILLNPYQNLQPEPRPRQDLQPEPRPRQDLQPEPRPRQDLQPDPKPRQPLDPEPRPRQDLQPGAPRQLLDPGRGKPLTEPPGMSKPGPTSYQTWTRTRQTHTVWRGQ